MLSRSGLYALQAALHLAQQPEGTRVSAALMAERLDVPAEYLAKVLSRMTRHGLLTSTRGPGGGVQLAGSPDDLTVDAVTSPFEELRPMHICLLGGPCDTENPCAAHQQRERWNTARHDILRRTTLSDLLDESTNSVGG